MKNSLSVILCTHNPKHAFLSRVLQGLKKQTLDFSGWELIIVDNDSEKPVKDQFDISWHPNSRFVLETKLGLTHARLHGISAATGELLVFFDDDNVPNPDYLEQAREIAFSYPFIGAFGGNQIGEFEIDPPEHLRKYLGMLAVREIDRDKWSNLYIWDTTPVGAGMVIRKNVAMRYAENVQLDKLRGMMDRKGKSLLSAGDNDMAYTACDMGYGMGLFQSLYLIHIIPKSRLDEKYFLNLTKYMTTSSILLDFIRSKENTVRYQISLRPALQELKNVIRLKKNSFASFIFEIKRIHRIIEGKKLAIKITKRIF